MENNTTSDKYINTMGPKVSEPLSTQAKKYNYYNNPQNPPAGCEVSYPLGSLLDSSKPGVVGNDFSTNFQGYIPKNTTIRENFVNTTTNEYMATNDPASDMLLDLKKRPINDFVHNNMVPFYGSSVKQNMAGTGIESGNYIDGKDVSSGFDNTTPYQNKLNNFTGIDDTYSFKRETGPMYTPAEQQTDWVYGTPDFRPDDSRYEVSLHYRNDLAPCEQQQVGPGLALSPEIPANGGFNSALNTRVMPNNVDDYKADQLPGRIITQGWQLGGKMPTALPGAGPQSLLSGGVGVPKNRPNSFWDQNRRPTMTTKVSTEINPELPRAQWQVDFKPNNSLRDQTSYGFGGPIRTESFSQYVKN